MPVVPGFHHAEGRRVPGPFVRSEGGERSGSRVKVGGRKKPQYPMPSQIIVYCDTVAKTVRFAKVSGYVCYHRQVGSRGEKEELVRELTEGRQQTFTARMVRKVQDYAQENGRAGRDGLKSEAIIVRGVTCDQQGKMREGG